MDIIALGRAAGKNLAANANAASLLRSLDQYGARFGLDKPHRLAHYIAQVAHESAGFAHDSEIWGPTEAQKRYEGRADLGNTQPGDGFLFRGRSPIQITGRANYRQFRDWCRANVTAGAPDFEAFPDLVCSDPWEGLAPIWYWTTRNLNTLADRAGDQVEAITRKINGGTNGLADRQRYYGRTALVMLGYGPGDVRQAQADLGIVVDGSIGPSTRASLHTALIQKGTAAPKPALNPMSPWAALWRSILAALGR